MLEEVVLILSVEKRLHSIWTVDCSVGNVVCGIHKKIVNNRFCTSKSIVISEGSSSGI